MSAGASPLSQTNRSKRQSQIVTDDNQGFRNILDFFSRQQTRDRFSAQIHERLRLYQPDTLVLNRCRTNQRPAFLALYSRSCLRSQLVNQHETQVVARPRISSARVSQSND